MQAELLYKAPLRPNLAESEGSKFRTAKIVRLLMKLRDSDGDARLVHRCLAGIVKRCDDGIVHAFGARKTVCAVHHDVDPALGQCRNCWPVVATPRPESRKQPQFARVDLRRPSRSRSDRIDMTA